EQRAKMKELTARVGRQWWESLNNVGRLPPARRGEKIPGRARRREGGGGGPPPPARQGGRRPVGVQYGGAGGLPGPARVGAGGPRAARADPGNRRRSAVRLAKSSAAGPFNRRPQHGSPGQGAAAERANPRGADGGAGTAVARDDRRAAAGVVEPLRAAAR